MSEKPLIDPATEKVVSLAEETKFAPNGIVSRTLLRTDSTRVVLFGFAEGQELTEHTSTQQAVIQILSGECEFSLAGQPRLVKAGDLLYMPPNLRHAVKSTKSFSMLLTLTKPIEKPAAPNLLGTQGCFAIGLMPQPMSANTTTLDVREDIRDGREPFSKIMAAIAGLAAQENLLIIAPFEPTPLFQVLAKQGFAHESKRTDTGDWQVLFTRLAEGAVTGGPPQVMTSDRGSVAVVSAQIVDLDARGLEPPQPLVTILEAISTLPPGATLRARTDRRPMHLYAQLESRGFAGESTEQSDGSFITHIRSC